MDISAPGLSQLIDEMEDYGNQLALLADITTIELSTRGKLGAMQFAISTIHQFSDIERRLKNYREAAISS